VLYLHGFTDYFFQIHHAEAWIEAGYDFYALDLRRSGRSAAGHPRPGDVRDLRVHEEEIELALGVMREGGADQVVLLGHSTGGLQATLWAHDHPGTVDALVLNSPWLEVNAGWFTRGPLTAVIDRLAAVAPAVTVGTLRPSYGRHLHAGSGGEWDFDLTLKPHEGFPARAGFIRSVRRAQAEVAAGLDVDVPVLLACSTRSGDRRDPGPADLSSSDVVLDVSHMIARAPMIGEDVTILQVPGGVHDLALSAQPAREYYTRSTIEWVGGRLGESG
jgi:alpha-beta hydrolase superfamily lysophospholipase